MFKTTEIFAKAQNNGDKFSVKSEISQVVLLP